MKKEKVKIYDFTRLNIEVEFDVFKEMDFSKQIANEIHMGTADIGLDDIARKIYYEGKAEIPSEEMRQQIMIIIANSHKIVPIKRAVQELLSK